MEQAVTTAASVSNKKLPPRQSSSSRNTNRSNNSKNKRNSHSRQQHKRGMPQPQQVKMKLSGLEDVVRYGRVEQILELVRAIVHRVNEDNTHRPMFAPIQLDEPSIQRLFEQENLVEAAKTEIENEEKEGEVAVVETDGNVAMAVVEKTTVQSLSETTPETKFAAVVKGADSPQQEAKGPVVRARALYVVPPKKSRRRGIKRGCAYLVLTGPTVAEKEEDYAAMTSVQQSRATAKTRLQLITTVEALTRYGEAEQDAANAAMNSSPTFRQAISGKAWKPNYWDNREGTVETTPDYKRFIAKAEKEEEERMARPRPTPGGATGGDADASDNGEQVAAIVLHLQAKRKQEARRRKANAKKSTPAAGPSKGRSNQGGGLSKVGGGTKNSGRSGGAKKERGRKGDGRTKADKSKSAKPPSQPPVVMNASNFPVL